MKNMTAKVVLWGTTIGTISVNEGEPAIFEYDPDFIDSGIEVCPLMMPLARTPYSFPGLPKESFHGLPGMLADSLPDRYGNNLINAWLVQQGRQPNSMNAVERLCYTGTRGMGALEFYPAIDIGGSLDALLAVDELARLASDILNQRELFQANIHDNNLENLISIGTSAGGARAKAVIAIHKETGEVRSGQIATDENYQHWLIKFDNIEHNRDKEADDDEQYTLVEYAYYRMALEAGVTMMECRILDTGVGRHFLTRRFDRTETGGKLHMLSLAGMAHFDYNDAAAHSYEEVGDILRRIGCGYPAFRQLFRRMVFNHFARNYDDHVKNISFLMNRSGQWSLAPAYDVSFAYNPTGPWTSRHQMRINGKTTDIKLGDLINAGKNIGVSLSDIREDLAHAEAAVNHWPAFAEAAGIREEYMEAIRSVLIRSNE